VVPVKLEQKKGCGLRVGKKPSPGSKSRSFFWSQSRKPQGLLLLLLAVVVVVGFFGGTGI
jgi:hypothetical protein